MTRRTYELLSDNIRRAIESPAYVVNIHMRGEVVARAVAEALAADNKAFDPVRFLRECGVQS